MRTVSWQPVVDWLFIDGSSLIFRAFHGVPAALSPPRDVQTNATRGFLDTIARLVRERRPRRLAVASDADWRPDWRVQLIPSYKQHRTAEPVPPALIPQFVQIEAILAAIGVEMVGVAGFEAEDVIATWAAAAGAEAEIEIVSGDRDLFALVDGRRVKVLYPEKAGLSVIDSGEVEHRYGVPAHLYADFAILRGDPSDGLPGLKGVGPKGAAQLIREHGAIRALIERGSFTPAQIDYLERALVVVPPRIDVPVDMPAGRLDGYPRDGRETQRLGAELAVERPIAHLLEALRSGR